MLNLPSTHGREEVVEVDMEAGSSSTPYLGSLSGRQRRWPASGKCCAHHSLMAGIKDIVIPFFYSFNVSFPAITRESPRITPSISKCPGSQSRSVTNRKRQLKLVAGELSLPVGAFVCQLVRCHEWAGKCVQPGTSSGSFMIPSPAAHVFNDDSQGWLGLLNKHIQQHTLRKSTKLPQRGGI